MVSVHKWFVGLFLTVIMVLAMASNAWLFSARAFQYNLAQSSRSANGVIDVQRLAEVDRQIRQIQTDTRDTRGTSLQTNQELDVLNTAIAASTTQLNTLRADVTGDLVTVEASAAAPVAEAASMLDASMLGARLTALSQRPNLSAADQQRIAALRGQIDRLSQLETQLGDQDRRRATLILQQRTVGGQVAEADRRILALQQTVVPSVEQYDRVVSEVAALRNSSPFNIGVMLVQMHPAFISTLLVLLMGALGAILYLFPAYMSRENEVTFAEIVVRMIFGTCAALAFYIVANATLAGFSFTSAQQTGAQSASSLNPFTVSLIGIVAGVMADDLAAWIKNRGGEIFRGGGTLAQQAPAGQQPANSTAPAGSVMAPQSNTRTATATSSSPINEHGGQTPL